MKLKKRYSAFLLLAAAAFVASCKKTDGISSTTPTSTTQSTNLSVSASSDGSISLASYDSSKLKKKDTLFLVNCFPPSKKPDTVAKSALPAAITAYLDTAYAGYTFQKAFKVNTTGFVVVIKYNSNFVGVKFDANGAFVAVLEQRMGDDKKDPRGAHPGGPFPCRIQGPVKDTVALSAVPSVVLNAFKAKYPTDTLVHAGITPDTTYVLISKNNGLFATAIKANGTIFKRSNVGPAVKILKSIGASALPVTIPTYLTATYPGYVLDKAFEVVKAGVAAGYFVSITANSTKYIVAFDATGKFVKAIAIH